MRDSVLYQVGHEMKLTLPCMPSFQVVEISVSLILSLHFMYLVLEAIGESYYWKITNFVCCLSVYRENRIIVA